MMDEPLYNAAMGSSQDRKFREHEQFASPC